MTREQAVIITEAAREELDKVADDHPDIASAILVVRQMFDSAIEHQKRIYDDTRAIRYLGDMVKIVSRTLRLPIRMRMTDGYLDVLKSTQATLDSFAAELLGEALPDPCEPKTFERLTRADLRA
jgi:hypothetical protein